MRHMEPLGMSSVGSVANSIMQRGRHVNQIVGQGIAILEHNDLGLDEG